MSMRRSILSSALSLCLLSTATPALADEAAFAACLSGLRAEAAAKGVSRTTFDAHAAGLAPDMAVLGFLDAQPEFITPIWDYMAGLVDEERVADGRAMLAEWRAVLARVEAEYAVDAATVVAVWGVESNYGRNFGSRPLLTSLSTLSCFGRRQAFFRGEFFTTLKIIQEGHVAPERLTGSWAGAFGHTQFMPSTFMRLAVDFDGDGRRDLVDSVPDALASTANFLKRAGWRSDQPWGFEVSLPRGFDTAGAGRRNKQPMSDWAARGVRRVDGSPLPAGATPVGLLLPAGQPGPAFLVTRNFDALYSYNAAESYGLAIAHLSDRLRGAGSFVTAWPTDDPGLSRAERRELQQLLIERGHDIGAADGMIGARTREALKLEQLRLGLTADGRAGQRALVALRAQAGRQ
ncbi:lytic murein transglycosylase [Thauera sp.]|uniref:lytic murein transglycosylase n=1 Tax=Thauera sp. TaxID=1905334 RepID=UPI000EC58125|nr:lytic murein transglycosylase [Thauera sp.]HAG75272.1 lytic murein transglycosylase [Thauera sp.]HNR59599.1 lytic murein transglycosylase [Thauera sp.]HNS91359.1 lytic murein transglycosylase [Thauera sp.]